MLATDVLKKQAECRPKERAIVDVTTRREYTYEQLNNRANAIAEALTGPLGVKPGERIAMLTQNCSEFIEVLFGCSKAGIILVPLNWRLTVPELAYVMKDATPGVLIYESMFEEQAQGLQKEIHEVRTVVLGSDKGRAAVAYETLIEQASGAPVEMVPQDVDDPWYIIYTSGTTGKPKGVIQNFSMGLFNYLNIGVPLGLTDRDVTLNILPFFHTGGINLMTVPTLFVGGTAMILKAFDPAVVLKLLSREVTAFFGVPAIYQALHDHPAYADTDLSGVRQWASGGAPMPVSILEAYADDGVNIRQGFGMSETGPTVFLMDERNVHRKLGSVGKPQMFVDVRIAGDDGADQPPDTIGELWIRGPAVTPGYWKQPDKTAEAFAPDGWLRSGDLAKRDAEGYFYIVDRSKDMFISGGENVYPAEVENVLYQHPAVTEAAVIGIPDERWGEVGLAVVVKRPGHEITADELIGFSSGKLARYKIPKRVEFVETLPRNAGGKVVKPELRQQFAK